MQEVTENVVAITCILASVKDVRVPCLVNVFGGDVILFGKYIAQVQESSVFFNDYGYIVVTPALFLL